VNRLPVALQLLLRRWRTSGGLPPEAHAAGCSPNPGGKGGGLNFAAVPQ